MSDSNQRSILEGCPPYILDVLNRFRELKDFHKMLDFTVICRGQEWLVHRAILALHSAPPATACGGDFQEGQQATIDLSVERREVVDALILFMYHFRYVYTGCTDNDDESDFLHELGFHVKMNLLADQFDMAALKHFSTKAFENALKDCKDSAVLAQAARLAYDARSVTKDICIALVTYLATDKGFDGRLYEESEIGLVIRENPAFAMDMNRALRVLIDVERAKDDFQCGDCESRFFVEMEDSKQPYYTCPFCKFTVSGKEWHSKHKVSRLTPGLEHSAWWRE